MHTLEILAALINWKLYIFLLFIIPREEILLSQIKMLYTKEGRVPNEKRFTIVSNELFSRFKELMKVLAISKDHIYEISQLNVPGLCGAKSGLYSKVDIHRRIKD